TTAGADQPLLLQSPVTGSRGISGSQDMGNSVASSRYPDSSPASSIALPSADRDGLPAVFSQGPQ
ncbi:unnamed protein product, partial [Amoebophrya sp. A25]